jgi:hypothetical protein
MDFKNIQRNRWHDRSATGSSRLNALYGSPRAWFRRSFFVPADQLNHITDSRDEKYIRCAAVFPQGQNLTALTRDCWAIWVNGQPFQRTWQMLLTSPEDAVNWVENAYTAGAIAWYIFDDQPQWYFRPLEHTTDPDLDTRPVPKEHQRGPGLYDPASLEADIKSRLISVPEMAEKYGISRAMIYKIRGRFGIMGAPVTRRRQRVDQLDTKAIIADIHSRRLTRGQIARKHNCETADIANIIRRYKLAGILPKQRHSPGMYRPGRPQLYDYDAVAVARDLRDFSMTKQEIAEKHGIKLSTLNGIQQKQGITRNQLRGFATKPYPRQKGVGVGVEYKKKQTV